MWEPNGCSYTTNSNIYFLHFECGQKDNSSRKFLGLLLRSVKTTQKNVLYLKELLALGTRTEELNYYLLSQMLDV